MPDVMSLSATVAVTGGPEVSVSSSFVLAGYDVTSFTVDSGGGERTMPVQPGAIAQVRVLAVTASRYDPAALTYELGGIDGINSTDPSCSQAPACSTCSPRIPGTSR